MNILITGGSSFTGYWFIRTLRQKGHTITATVRGNKDSYTGLRRERIRQVEEWADIVWDCSFGDATFQELLTGRYDLLCHHGAQVENYRSPDFDVPAALHSNSLNARVVIEKALLHGTRRLILTGSVFEANEGIGNGPLIAFSPYGLSKTITWETFRYWCLKSGLSLGKFVIPNPFGPYEEPRFCNFLLNSWKKGEIPEIKTPDYIRDNIHVSQLALAYADWAGKENCSPVEKLGPCGYIESQGNFARRFAEEMGKRLPLACVVKEARQTVFDEPVMRVNNDKLLLSGTVWDEGKAWDELASYYRETLLKKPE
jgi:nucleoside-diphosphate-sugar epimerase